MKNKMLIIKVNQIFFSIFYICFHFLRLSKQEIVKTRYYAHSKLNFLENNSIELNLNGDVARFIAFGDWGGLDIWPYRTLVEQNIGRYMSKLADDFEIHFQLVLGDNFYFNGVANASDQRFKETFEDVFDEKNLNMPWFVLLGNHDHYGNASAQIEYTKESKRWVMPSFNYSINVKANNGNVNLLHILMIDTVLLCGNSGYDWSTHSKPRLSKQEKYLADSYFKDIEEHLKRISVQNFTYIFIAGHFPVFSVAEHGPTECLVENLRPLLHKYNIKAYLAGHEHDMEHLQDTYLNSTVEYIISGASNIVYNSTKHQNDVPKDSLKYYWAEDFQLHGALCLFEVTFENVTVSYHETTGKTLYRFVIQK